MWRIFWGRCIVHSLKWNRNKWASIWGKGFPDIADANGDFDGVYTAGTDILASNGGLTDGLGDFTVDTATLNGQTYRL